MDKYICASGPPSFRSWRQLCMQLSSRGDGGGGLSNRLTSGNERQRITQSVNGSTRDKLKKTEGGGGRKHLSTIHFKNAAAFWFNHRRWRSRVMTQLAVAPFPLFISTLNMLYEGLYRIWFWGLIQFFRSNSDAYIPVMFISLEMFLHVLMWEQFWCNNNMIRKSVPAWREISLASSGRRENRSRLQSSIIFSDSMLW